MTKFILALGAPLVFVSPALAQPMLNGGQPPVAREDRTSPGALFGGQNNTGGVVDVTIPRGATGADTYQSNSAAAGNANQPSRAVPLSSGGGGSGAGGN